MITEMQEIKVENPRYQGILLIVAAGLLGLAVLSGMGYLEYTEGPDGSRSKRELQAYDDAVEDLQVRALAVGLQMDAYNSFEGPMQEHAEQAARAEGARLVGELLVIQAEFRALCLDFWRGFDNKEAKSC